MTEKWTSGPWRVESLEPEIQTIRSQHIYIASIYDSAAQKQNGANANLIAAAPDLYDALQDTLNMLRAAHIQCGVHHDGNKRVQKVRAVLAKARGEELKP